MPVESGRLNFSSSIVEHLYTLYFSIKSVVYFYHFFAKWFRRYSQNTQLKINHCRPANERITFETQSNPLVKNSNKKQDIIINNFHLLAFSSDEPFLSYYKKDKKIWNWPNIEKSVFTLFRFVKIIEWFQRYNKEVT